jgi:uncharacterized membrane protein
MKPEEDATKTIVDGTASARPASTARRGVNWLRFWIQILVAILVFNIVMAFITAYFIFPYLHPAKSP